MFAQTWSREATHDVRGVFDLYRFCPVLSSHRAKLCVEDLERTRFMPPKRKRNARVGTNGFVASGKPKSHGCWGWVSSEVRDMDDITLEHRMTASNLSIRNGNPLCQNKYSVGRHKSPVFDAASPTATHVNGELSEDIIVVSDADEPLCTKKACKRNPYCLNYLGQDMWDDEGYVIYYW